MFDEDDVLENLDSVKIWFDDELASFVDYSPLVITSRIGQPFVIKLPPNAFKLRFYDDIAVGVNNAEFVI